MRKFYYSGFDTNYNEQVASFILENYSNNLSDLTIFLPNGFACREIQLEIVRQSENHSVYLPKIMTFAEFANQGNSCILGKNKADPISETLEVISAILHDNSLCFNLKSAVTISHKIINTFYDLCEKKKSASSLQALCYELNSEYFTKIIDSLSGIQYNLESKLEERLLLPSYRYQSEFLEKCFIDSKALIIGVITNNESILKLIRSISDCKIILPPIDPNNIQKYPHIQQFLNEIGATDVYHLPSKYTLQKIETANKPIYYEYDTEYEEALNVSNAISKILTQDSNAIIDIITEDERAKSIFLSTLKQFNVFASSSSGMLICDSMIGEFIMQIAEFIVHEFCVHKLLNIMKSEYAVSEDVYKLDILLRGKFIESAHDILKEIRSAKDSKIQKWCESLLQKIMPLHNTKNPVQFKSFTEFLTRLVHTAEELSMKSLWTKEYGTACAEFLETLIQESHYFKVQCTNYEYLYLLRHLMRGAKFYPFKSSNNVRIINLKESIFSKAKHTFLVNCTEEAYTIKRDAFVPSKISEKLGLSSFFKHYFDSYYFEVILNKKNLHVTRPKVFQGKETAKLLAVDEFIGLGKIEANIRTQKLKHSLIVDTIRINHKNIPAFPDRISITNVEMLLNHPFGFYASKILNLKKLEDINPEISVREFGNLIHKVFEQSLDFIDYEHKLEEIMSSCFSEYPKLASHLWLEKARKILRAFAKQYKSEMQYIKRTYAEVHGYMWVDLNNGKKCSLYGIADRLDITHDNQILILDYKTGTVPTSKELKWGLKPQLVLESFIFNSGGFRHVIKGSNLTETDGMRLKHVGFIKVSTQAPHLVYSSYEFGMEELNKHMESFMKLLNHYSNLKTIEGYIAEPHNSLKYNVYSHMQRL